MTPYDRTPGDLREARIIAFLCSWCAYRGADLAGSMRVASPSSIRVVRVPCSGRVAPELVLRAFQDGADGVLVLGCHPGDCHFLEGNQRMVRRMRVLQKLMGYAGIEPERLRWDFVSAAEGKRFGRVAVEFDQVIRSLPLIRDRLLVGDPDLHAGEGGSPLPGDGGAGRRLPDAMDRRVKASEDPRWPALRDAVREGLSQTDGVLALRRVHGVVAPHLFHEEAELEDLALWPKYPLPDVLRRLHGKEPDARLGIVCRRCEERGLVEVAKRGQVDWDRLHLIGVACTQEEVEACRCSDSIPAHAPAVVDAPRPAKPIHPADEQRGFLPRTAQDRLAFWRYWSDRCIKCYACATACPQCFCPGCALEDPLWVEPGRVPPPFPAFHLIKSIHMAGRCTQCRECEIACPSEIPLLLLHRMVGLDLEEIFGYRAGASLDEMPPLLLASEERAHP